MTEVCINRWRIQDVAWSEASQVAGLMRAIFSDPFILERTIGEAEIQEYLRDSRTHVNAITSSEGDWIGVLVYTVLGNEIVFHHFGVQIHHRHFDLLWSVLAVVKTVAHDLGVSKLRLTTYSSEEGLIRLYQRLGFVQTIEQSSLSGFQQFRTEMSLSL